MSNCLQRTPHLRLNNIEVSSKFSWLDIQMGRSLLQKHSPANYERILNEKREISDQGRPEKHMEKGSL